MAGMEGMKGMEGMSMPGMSDESAVPGRAAVDLDEGQRQLINIRTAPVASGPAVVTIRAVGTIAYDQSRITNINPRIMGWAQKLYVDKPGQFVKQGDPLLDLYSPNLYSAQYEYLLAFHRFTQLEQKSPTSAESNGASPDLQDNVAEARNLLASARRRLRLWEISDAQIASLEQSGQPSDTLQLRSSATGYVIDKAVDPAQMVRPGTTLYRIADLSKIWVNASVYEYELPFVKVGQNATVTAVALPGRTFEATVDFIYPYSENKTRTTLVRLVMDNADGLFRPAGSPPLTPNVRIELAPFGTYFWASA